MGVGGRMAMAGEYRVTPDHDLSSKKCLAVASLLAVAIMACARHDDLEESFRLTGKVTDSFGRGLPGVEVFFIDTGIDEGGRRKKEERLVGVSDEAGQIDIEFLYPWGYTYRTLTGSAGDPSRRVPGTFTLALRKATFVERREHFSIWRLKSRDGKTVVALEVAMRRSEAS